MKGQEVHIILEDTNSIFQQPYKCSEVERTLVQAQTLKLLEASLVDLFKGGYASTIVLPIKKDNFGNWTKCCMCGDYRPINKRMHFGKYAMPLCEEIFDVLGQAMVFSTLNVFWLPSVTTQGGWQGEDDILGGLIIMGYIVYNNGNLGVVTIIRATTSVTHV